MRTAAVAAAALLAGVVLSACGGGGSSPGSAGLTPQAPAGQGTDHALGPQDAPVVIVEYADYQ